VYYSDPRGELLFFVKPEAVLRLVISTPQRVYKPGDLVDFEVRILNPQRGPTGALMDNYVSVVVTDDSVYRQIPSRSQPPSLPA
jgi:hypothetical protein